MRAIVPSTKRVRMDHWLFVDLLAQVSRASEIRQPFPSPEWIWSIGAVLFAVWLFAMGASVGSFLNVVVYRVPAGLNLVSPGSRCPRCLHPIRAQHNIPIFGWLALGGRCADCQLPISTRYPLVELLLGTIFLVVGSVELIGNGVNLPRRVESNFGPPIIASSSETSVLRPALTTKEPWPLGVTVTIQLALVATLIGAALIDFDRHPIPSRLVTPIMVATLAASLVWPQLHPVPGISPTWWATQDPELGFDPALKDWRAGLIDVVLGGLAGGIAAILFYCSAWYRPWLRRRYAVPVGLMWVAIGMVFGWQMVPWILGLWSVQLWLSLARNQDLVRQPLLLTRGLVVAVVVSLLGWRWIAGYSLILEDTLLSRSIIYGVMTSCSWVLLSAVAAALPVEFDFPRPVAEPVFVPPEDDNQTDEPITAAHDSSPTDEASEP